ncbi:MAG: hypothetical protein JRJ02_12900 [Deltaproteobacteria bacterium]|nr:hypothetical protein [Deltaproteobacteria bacterium]
MEYLNAVNIITVIIILLMLYFLKKLFTGDIGENRFFYIMALIVLGVGLYLWRSGAVVKVIANILGTF